MTRVSGKPIEIRVSQPTAGSDEPTFPPYKGPAFFSYGFRPFFFFGASYAALIIAIWLPAIVGPSPEKQKRDERMDRGRAGSLRNR